MAVKIRRHPSEGAAPAFHADVGNRKIGQPLLRHHRNRSALQRIGHKRMAVALMPFPCAEHRTGGDAAGIIGQRGDLRLLRPFPGADFHSVHDLGQLHGVSLRATTAVRLRLSCSATWVAISRNAGPATWPP